jgi:hypothetical protein
MAAPAFAAFDGGLVVNGDFSSPNNTNSNRYFGSDYTRHSYPTGTNVAHGTGPGYFELGTDPALDNSTWTSVGAYNNPGGQFLLVDGSNTGSTDNGATNADNGTARVWDENISVKQGVTYSLGAYADAFDSANQAFLDFSLTGDSHTMTRGGWQLNGSQVGVWKALNSTWTAPATETVTFSIIDKETATSGNDFGLDDISFKPVPEASTLITFAILCLGGVFILRKRSQPNASA